MEILKLEDITEDFVRYRYYPAEDQVAKDIPDGFYKS